MKTILAPATGTEVDGPVFRAALDVARLFGGHIDILHARKTAADLASELAMNSGGELSVGIIDKLEEQAAEMEEKAQAAFEKFARLEGLAGSAAKGNEAVSAAWHCEKGREEEWVPAYGRTSDLIVVGRPAKDDTATRATQEAALFETGRPILIPGSAPVGVDTVAVAWKSTREAARAVTAAMPLIVKAKRVLVLTVTEPGTDEDLAAGRLVTTLRRQVAAVELHRISGDRRPAAQVLLAEANERGAGLIVMGGYGHSRLREWVFGGVTEYVLRASALPVLMAH